MSRLCAGMTATDTGRRMIEQAPIRYTTCKTDAQTDPMQCLTVYRVGVTFAATTAVSDILRDSGRQGAGVDAIGTAKRQITHEVFGEYEAPLREALHLMYSMDNAGARRLIERVLNNFHDPEPFDPR